MGVDGFPLRLRELPSGEPICSDVEGGLWRRMQDCRLPSSTLRFNSKTFFKKLISGAVYTPVYNLPLESRPHCAHQKNKHLSDLRTVEELLSVLHARFVLWPTYRCA